ncbi:MAG: chorismate lyase [Magnetococcales bacterium]|nr:chorismate lyase [Magnetococcales bacterium]
MSLPFSLQLLTPWLLPDPFPLLEELPVAPRYREMLSSTDSLTRRLERLTGAASRVRLEKQFQHSVLEEDPLLWGPEYRIPDAPAILSRQAWLALGEQDLVFAHSQLSLVGLAPSTCLAIEQGEAPLGALFLARDEPVERRHLRLAVGVAPALARSAGLAEDHRFVLRRSLFLVAGAACGRILELFLTDLSQ